MGPRQQIFFARVIVKKHNVAANLKYLHAQLVNIKYTSQEGPPDGGPVGLLFLFDIFFMLEWDTYMFCKKQYG